MQTKDLNKSLTEIFSNKYLVPLYQRNYAWSEEEISLLLLDLYEAFKLNPDGNYFIGSLVVLKRRDGFFEVIDGQQRLTTLTLLSKILETNFSKEPKLFYESRPEVESFLDIFYRTSKTDDVTFDHKVSHLINAVDIIKETIINPEEKELHTITTIKEKDAFISFFEKNVILVRVEIPDDTDVASYFEIMNNRGEQLQKHEILKAKLMEQIKDVNQEFDKAKQLVFSTIWDACSQIDIPIQKLFGSVERKALFGSDFDNYNGLTEYHTIISNELNNSNSNEVKLSINSILDQDFIHKGAPKRIEDIDDEGNDQSIIDFPNFLMHVFKLEFNQQYLEKTGVEVPLNEKDLISVYETLKDTIDPMKFISNLLFCKVVFDRYVVKTTTDENAEENYKWTLLQPYKYFYATKNSHLLKYKNSFSNQERLIKALSLLQVTFRNKKYKNWLQDLFEFFKSRNVIPVEQTEFQQFLDNWIINYYSVLKQNNTGNNLLHLGTHTPHFLFNFIDYLFWLNQPTSNRPTKLNFDFKYRNSVEHHLPQSFSNDNNKEFLDSIGNLCLVSKSLNSKMNNEDPKGKASKYFKETLPPKQKVIYEITNSNNSWNIKEIELHRKEIDDLLNTSFLILKQLDSLNQIEP
jgi:uncharacterized protein with ParB-like and HNH nuclease domain